jgi:hypothetical protein
MNGVDTIRLREETTFISCFEYESVHHQHHLERERRREKFPLSLEISFYNWTIAYLSMSIKKKTISILRIVLILSVNEISFEQIIF